MPGQESIDFAKAFDPPTTNPHWRFLTWEQLSECIRLMSEEDRAKPVKVLTIDEQVHFTCRFEDGVLRFFDYVAVDFEGTEATK